MIQTGTNVYFEGQMPDARALFDALNTGRMFTVTFMERTKGEVRTMNARTGVKSHLKGNGSLRFNPFEKGLVPCYDVKTGGYRFFNVEGIRQLKVDGVIINFGYNR